MNILGILQNEPGVELLVDDEETPHGVLVKGPWFWYLHTVDELFLEAFVLDLEQHAGFYRFSGVWRPLAEKLKAVREAGIDGIAVWRLGDEGEDFWSALDEMPPRSGRAPAAP